jgi:hypothetical protein
VVASSGPEIGALLAAGTSKLLAKDAGVRSILEAMTIPTTSDARAISTP